MPSQEFTQEMHQALEAQKQKLAEELQDLKPHTEVGDDYGDAAVESEIDNVNHDLIERISADLEKIEHALAKIANGTYGVDDEGKEISEDRLRALPWADKAI